MINDELKEIWKSSSQVEKVKFEKSRLILEMQSSIDSLNKKIRLRDMREIFAAVLVIPIFIYYAIIIPYPITKIASILIVIWASFIIAHLRQTKKYKPSEYSEDYLTYLEKNKQYLQKQKKLLDTVLWWYITPFLFCLVLFILGFVGVPEKKIWMVTTLIGGIILALIVYFMNKKYSKQDFENRLSKIEDLIKVMQSPE